MGLIKSLPTEYNLGMHDCAQIYAEIQANPPLKEKWTLSNISLFLVKFMIRNSSVESINQLISSISTKLTKVEVKPVIKPPPSAIKPLEKPALQRRLTKSGSFVVRKTPPGTPKAASRFGEEGQSNRSKFAS